MNTNDSLVQQLDRQIDRLTEARNLLAQDTTGNHTASAPAKATKKETRGRKRMPLKERDARAKAMRARWRATKKAGSNTLLPVKVARASK